MRTASQSLDSYSAATNRDLKDTLFTDYGNLTSQAESSEASTRLVGDATRVILGTEAIPIIFGDDGSSSPAAVRATLDRFPGLTVIQVGAAPNLSNDVDGDRWHPRCATTRILDRLPADQLLQVGLREGNKEEFSEMREDDRLVSIADLSERIGEGPLYLSFQLSAFEPSFVSATGIHEPGGLLWGDFEKLIDAIPWKQVRAIDYSGLLPDSDMTGYSSLVAAKLLREFILGIPQPK
ncbi:arginase family protein [bacterium]|nr:arginase family protein [Akkermansiaceae bacterium]MDB4284636.1 arginase family protein [bacterium]